MHKRLEIIVRNPGLEGTENALGSYSFDFDDPAVFEAARAELARRLNFRGDRPETWSMVFRNSKGEEQGINPEYYVSHRIADVEDWQSPWILPSHGAGAPNRES